MKRPRGTGSILRMKGSAVLWIKYHRNGIPIRESAHTTKPKEAEKFLRKRLGEISTGVYAGPKLEKIKVSELAEDLIREYRINRRKSIDDLEARWKLHLQPFFGVLRTIEVTSQLVAQYIDSRQQEKAENATINRELAALKRMFNLARQSTPPKVNSVPYIAMLKEDNIRTGFLESKQHDSLAAETGKIGLWLRAMFETGYTYGWRHEELLALRVRQVNLMAGTIRLEPGTTKNDEGREVTMTLPVRALLTQCVHGKSPDDHVFTREDGTPVRDFRGAWSKACEAAKAPGLLFHDLRRSAARNLRRAGVAEGVIMKIGGWKTRSVFERYAIVSQTDIRDAMVKLEAGQQREKAKAAREQQAAQKQFGQSLGRMEQERPDSQSSSLKLTPQVN
jgi:integrase